MDGVELTLTGADRVERSAEGYFDAITWSGDVGQCARTLETAVWPTVACELGQRARLYVDGAVEFDGFIFERGRDMDDGESPLIALTCFDRGLYLKRTEAAYKFNNMTPEAMVARVCADYGIRLGTLARTGVRLSRNFPGVSLYKMIATAYTLAAEETGARYAVRFRGEALEVVAKERTAETVVIRPGGNLRGGRVEESVSAMINQVAIYDDNGALVGTQRDREAIGLYGLMQKYLRQSKDRSGVKEAQTLLEDNGVGQKITVTVDGDKSLLSGGCAVMRESVTGLQGLFWIDRDTHIWTREGDYETRLTLNFRNMMDEQGAGSANAGA